MSHEDSFPPPPEHPASHSPTRRTNAAIPRALNRRASVIVLIILGTAALLQPDAYAGFGKSLADLFHGKPVPAKKAPPPSARPTISRAPEVAMNLHVDQWLGAYSDALMARDLTPLSGKISSTYAIPGLPQSVSPTSVLRQAIEQLPAPSSIRIIEISPSAAGTQFRASFQRPQKPAKTHAIQLDKEGKLVSSDLFAVRVQGHDRGALE